MLSLPVADQGRARDFYVDVLGFEVLQDTEIADVDRLRGLGQVFPEGIQDHPGGRYVTFADPDGIALVLQETRAQRPVG